MIISVHQPNFIPHPGYFAKIAAADRFIFFDSAQFARRSFTCRNRLLEKTRAQWVTVPVIKADQQSTLTKHIQISYDQPWQRKLLECVRHEYADAPYQGMILEMLETVFADKHEYLATLNLTLIERILTLLEITTPFTLSSTLASEQIPERDVSRRLIELTNAISGKSYLSGPSGRKYLEPDLFEKSGLALAYFDSSAPVYAQGKRDFVSQLSVLDMLMWIGPQESATVVRNLVKAANESTAQ